jgi:beta-galactosidase
VTEILPPHVPLARFRQTVPLDLSKVANRALADDADDDGKGGWTDQGPGADMRALPTGEQRMGGVLFKIPEGPKSIVVLKNQPRSKGDLPAKVTIPVGRKFDTLFFLHSGAWCNTDLKEFFHYVIHYADGKDVTLTVGPQNLRDWIGEPVARFPLEQDTFSTVAATVRVTQFGRGSVYRMEWSASPDRRPVEIKSIEFASEGKAVPVLLGITGVLEW